MNESPLSVPVDMRRTSDLLKELVLEDTAESLTLAKLMTALDDRAFGFMLFLLAFPVCLPMPPGFSSLMGLCMMPIAIQYVLGHRRPKLPRRFRDQPIHRAAMARAVRFILPGLIWLEKFIRPRWHYVTQGIGDKIVGLLIILLIMELITPLPPPLHFLPASGIAMAALGIMERDGALMALGAIIGIGGLAVVGALGQWVVHWLMHIKQFWG